MSAVLRPDFQLSWMSSALEYGFPWLLGRGIWRFNINRVKTADLQCPITLSMEGDARSNKPFSMSAVTRLHMLHEQGFIPDDLAEPFEIEDGSSTMEWLDLDLSQDLAFLAYGMSDTIAAFFLAGAEKVKFQISRKRMQLWMDVGMSNEEIGTFIARPRDYDETTTVGHLPWRKEKNSGDGSRS